MAKSTRKKTKGTISRKKSRKTTKGKTNVAECIDCLLELHKLQGVLLAQLHKEL